MADLLWTLEPEFAFTRRRVRRGVQSQGGFSQRRALTERELPVYVLRWNQGRQAAIVAIERFWALSKRGVIAFLYTPPGESERRVHLVGPRGYRLTNAYGGSVEVTLEAIR